MNRWMREKSAVQSRNAGSRRSSAGVSSREKAIVEHIDYYNNRRIKLKLNDLSPVQYRIQTVGAA